MGFENGMGRQCRFRREDMISVIFTILYYLTREFIFLGMSVSNACVEEFRGLGCNLSGGDEIEWGAWVRSDRQSRKEGYCVHLAEKLLYFWMIPGDIPFENDGIILNVCFYSVTI